MSNKAIVQQVYFQSQLTFQLQVALLYFGHSSAVAPTSVPLVWSQLLTVLCGAFVLNKVSTIRRYNYSTCQGLYLFETVRYLQIAVPYYYIEMAYM
jgi:hypothetical protein